MLNPALLEIVLTAHAWLTVIWRDLVACGSLVFGVACLWVAIRIYRRQKRETKIAHADLKNFLAIYLEEYTKSQGKPVTPDEKAKIKQFAGAAAANIQYLGFGNFMIPKGDRNVNNSCF